MAANLERMMENLITVQKNQLSSDELVRVRITRNENLIAELARQGDNQDLEIMGIKERMDNLELNEEITDEQVREIQARIKGRVTKILNYPNGDSDRYYQTFISNIYGYLRNNYSLGSRATTTKKKHYDTVMKGIEAWHPDVQELKNRKDKRDEAKGA